MNDDLRETLNMTTATVGRDLLQALVQELKLLPDVWPKLSKSKQDDVIERLTARVENNIRMAVHLIASEGRATAEATVDSVTFKGGIKVVLKLSKSSPQGHNIADSEGQLVLIVVADPAKHTQGMGDVRGEADQRAMDLGHEYDQNGDGKGMDGAGDSNVVDAEFIALPNSPLDSELQQYYDLGRAAAAAGDPKDAAPMVRHELVARWTQGWVDWHDEDNGDADPSSDTDGNPNLE